MHHVSVVKKGKPSALSKINRTKNKKRETGNRGKFSKLPAKKVKTSKRLHLIARCTTAQCRGNSNLVRPRCIKFEIR